MQLTFLTKKERERETSKRHIHIFERERERERNSMMIERGPFLNNIGNCLGVEDG